MRIKILKVVVSLLFLGISAGLIYSQVIRGHYYYQLSLNNRIRVVPLQARRGRVFDRNGILLASNRASFDVMIVAQEIEDKEGLFGYLSQVLNLPKDELLKIFKK